MIEALGDPRFYILFWACVFLATGRWLGRYLNAICLTLDGIYRELQRLK